MQEENKYHLLYLQEKARADKLQAELAFEDLEKSSDEDDWSAVYERNKPRKAVVEAKFQEILAWAGRNYGYSNSEDPVLAERERQATGLGSAFYLNSIEVDFALRFAAEVAEEWNWHSECATLLEMYQKVTQRFPVPDEDMP